MRVVSRFVVPVLSAVLLSGCYHAIIETGREANGTVISRPWAASFIAGLVPPPVIETAQRCPAGVAKVETQQSLPNMLASFLTGGLFSPMTITVSCAKATAMGPGSAVMKVGAQSPGEVLQQATERAAKDGLTVFVSF
jgi:hypothetical protein